MKEELHIWLQTHEIMILRVLGVLCMILFTLIIGLTFHDNKTKASQDSQRVKEYQITQTSLPESVPDVPATISFENIPDESFLPPQEGKLMRVNLVTMRIVKYENGSLVGTPITILKKPKVGSYWETPGGLYPITNKEEDYYSEKVGASLPFTMHLFGNYMIHGVPHDVRGRQLINNINGGIRLSTSDAEKLFAWADVDTRVSVYSDSKLKPEPISTESVYVTESGVIRPKVTAESYVVGDLDTGEIILENNKDTIHPIASISKLVTALVSIETMNQFDFATISKQASQVVSSARLKKGEKIALSNLMYPLLISSSNMAAEVIAEHYGRDNFITTMNDQAHKIGMQNTLFKDPSGLSAENVSTASDLFTLAKYIFKQKSFLYEITSRPNYSAQGYTWKNISQFLHTSGFIGGKGGQTDEARQAYVAIFTLPLSEVSNRNIAIIVLRSTDRYTDIMKILSYLKSRVIYGSPKNFTITSNKDMTRDITATFVGDIMLDRGVRYSVQKNFDGDYSHLFDKTDYLKASDITFANLEGPVSDTGTDLKNLYSFRMEPQVLDVIRSAGFDVVSFANNHIGDWGRQAFEDSLNRITSAGISFVGAGKTKREAEQPIIKEIKGMKIGFIGFSDVGPKQMEASDATSGILLASDPRFTEIIKNAKKQVDVLVVSIHWGIEYQEHNVHQTELAHQAIDAGANLVVGHHPHVVQAIETYHNGLIAYSLGNFIFDQAFSKETMQGMALTVTFDAKDKSIRKYDKYTSKLSPFFQPQKPELIK